MINEVESVQQQHDRLFDRVSKICTRQSHMHPVGVISEESSLVPTQNNVSPRMLLRNGGPATLIPSSTEQPLQGLIQ